jgi:hypothetical protein
LYALFVSILVWRITVDPSLFASQEALQVGEYVWIYRHINEPSDNLSDGSNYKKLPGLKAVVIDKWHLPTGKPQFRVRVIHPCSLDGSRLLVDTVCFNVFRPTKLDALLNFIIGGLQLLFELRNPRDNHTY